MACRVSPESIFLGREFVRRICGDAQVAVSAPSFVLKAKQILQDTQQTADAASRVSGESLGIKK